MMPATAAKEETHTYGISLVPYGNLTAIIAGLLAYLQEAAERTEGRSSIDDIVRNMYSGASFLWVVFDKDTSLMAGMFTTEVKKYPGLSALSVTHCVLDDHILASIDDDLHDLLTRYARDCGCGAVEFTGRRGWEKTAKKYGYAAASVVYRKAVPPKESVQ